MNDDAPPKYLEQPAVRAILEIAWRGSPRDGLMLEVSYLYGLRVSELVRLLRMDYRRDSMRLRISRSKGSVSGECPVFAHLRPKLDDYLARRRDHVPQFFAGRQGALGTRVVQILFDRYALAAGVALNDGQGIHSLRHSIAVHLLEADWSMPEVQAHLGHRSISSTQIYAKIVDRRRRERIEALATGNRVVIL